MCVLKFELNISNINIQFINHANHISTAGCAMWLVATVLDSTALNSETIDGNKHQTPNEHTSSFKHQFKAIPHGSYK